MNEIYAISSERKSVSAIFEGIQMDTSTFESNLSFHCFQSFGIAKNVSSDKISEKSGITYRNGYAAVVEGNIYLCDHANLTEESHEGPLATDEV